MFDFFEGKLHAKTPARIVLACNGIGYELTVPLSTYQTLPEPGATCRMLAYFHVNEAAQQLFGFATETERGLFKRLIAISGIGPKMALSILSGLGVEEFRKAVISGDVEVLVGIPGVGRKTAERLIVELREKLVLDGETAAKLPKGVPLKYRAVEKDAASALLALGFKPSEADQAIRKVFEAQKGEGELKVEEIVRLSLKIL